LGAFPNELTYDFINDYLYVSAGFGANVVYVIDTSFNKLIGNVSVGLAPVGVAFNRASAYIYVANSESNSVSVINNETNKVVQNITVGNMPSGIGYDLNSHFIYVANQNSNIVLVVDGVTNQISQSDLRWEDTFCFCL
jgi:YVTN family beta-propeller protein